MSLPKKRRKPSRKSRATKEQRVAVTREIVESARMRDGPEIDNIALKVHRALDGEEWHEAKMNLATMTGQFDERFDTALRLNMVLLEDLEQASADGKFTAAEKKKANKIKKSVETMQKSLLEDYYKGTPSGVLRKKMKGEYRVKQPSRSAEDDRYRAMKELREKALWQGTLIVGEPKDMKKTIPHGATDYAFVGVFGNPVLAVEELRRLRGQDANRKFLASGSKEGIHLYANVRAQDRPKEASESHFRDTREFDHDSFELIGAYSTREAFKSAEQQYPYPEYDTRQERDRTTEDYGLYVRKRRENELKALQMDFDERVKTLRKWLKSNAKTLNIRRGRGTGYSWLSITGTGKRKGLKTEEGWPLKFTPQEENAMKKMGMTYGHGGVKDTISPDEKKYWVEKALDELEGT